MAFSQPLNMKVKLHCTHKHTNKILSTLETVIQHSRAHADLNPKRSLFQRSNLSLNKNQITDVCGHVSRALHYQKGHAAISTEVNSVSYNYYNYSTLFRK